MVKVKSSLIVILIVLATAMFFASCDSNGNQKHCKLPDLYLEGQNAIYIDSTEVWTLKKKEVMRWDSTCTQDTVPVKYFAKTGVKMDTLKFVTQGPKVDLDSLVSANNCNTIGGATVDPYYPPSGGDVSNGGGFWGWFHSLPEWVQMILSFIGLILLLILIAFAVISLLGIIAGMWGSLMNALRTRRVETPVAPVAQQQPIAPVTQGEPSTTRTVMPDGSIIIPAAKGKLKKEEIKIHITREYYEDGTEK